jgi:hypothetical protein
MTRRTYAGRRTAGPRFLGRDAIHGDCLSHLRMYPGVSVWDTADVGGGFPDLCVGWRGSTFLYELKGLAGRLTPAEDEWHRRFRGNVKVVHAPDGAQACQMILDDMGYPNWKPGGERDTNQTGLSEERQARPA